MPPWECLQPSTIFSSHLPPAVDAKCVIFERTVIYFSKKTPVEMLFRDRSKVKKKIYFAASFPTQTGRVATEPAASRSTSVCDFLHPSTSFVHLARRSPGPLPPSPPRAWPSMPERDISLVKAIHKTKASRNNTNSLASSVRDYNLISPLQIIYTSFCQFSGPKEWRERVSRSSRKPYAPYY